MRTSASMVSSVLERWPGSSAAPTRRVLIRARAPAPAPARRPTSALGAEDASQGVRLHPGDDETAERWPWPMAVRPEWDAVRTDGTWHATYWIAEWPRIDVTPDFLGPLLLAPLRRSLVMVMEPMSPTRAARQVARARTADIADGELRQRSGFLVTARPSRATQCRRAGHRTGRRSRAVSLLRLRHPDGRVARGTAGRCRQPRAVGGPVPSSCGGSTASRMSPSPARCPSGRGLS